VSQRVVELIGAARAAGDPNLLAQRIPYARFMGISTELADGELLGVMRYHEQLIGNAALPALHGGTLGALLESTAIFEVLWQSETIVLPKTINLTVDFLRSGKPVDTYAAATITRRGRRVANVRAEAWQEDRARPIAAAHAHLLIVAAADADDG
jgi:uncharacterized protein (TIGR00369 family)